MRIGAILFLAWVLAGCASGLNIRDPVTESEKREYEAHARTIRPIRVALIYENWGLCQHLGLRCGLPSVVIGPGSGLGAAADGRLIAINFTMARFLRDDNERAFVLAHEWAHNLLGHVAGWTRPGINYILRNEFEADCVGAVMAKRAGYDPRAGAAIQRRMAMTHQDADVRAARIDATARRLATMDAGSLDRDTVRRLCGVTP